MLYLVRYNEYPERYDMHRDPTPWGTEWKAPDEKAIGFCQLRNGTFMAFHPDFYGEIAYARTWPSETMDRFDDDEQRHAHLSKAVKCVERLNDMPEDGAYFVVN